MGTGIEYWLNLRIKSENIQQALDTLNDLQTTEMLEKHADGCRSCDGRIEARWYSFTDCVKSTPESPAFEDIVTAINHWGLSTEYLAEIEEATGDLVLEEAPYEGKLGQQDFVLKQLAPVLEPMDVEVRSEYGEYWMWRVRDGKFEELEMEVVLSRDLEEAKQLKQAVRRFLDVQTDRHGEISTTSTSQPPLQPDRWWIVIHRCSKDESEIYVDNTGEVAVKYGQWAHTHKSNGVPLKDREIDFIQAHWRDHPDEGLHCGGVQEPVSILDRIMTHLDSCRKGEETCRYWPTQLVEFERLSA